MIRIRDVVMRLPSGGRPLTILDGVTLDVAAGEVCAITGPSGSGKSTLLGLIAGLDRPSAGSITVAGVEITELDEDALARFRRDTLGYVFQSYHLIPTLTAAENVAVPLGIVGVSDALGRAHGLLGDVGLGDRGHHYPVQLSGGDGPRDPRPAPAPGRRRHDRSRDGGDGAHAGPWRDAPGGAEGGRERLSALRARRDGAAATARHLARRPCRFRRRRGRGASSGEAG